MGGIGNQELIFSQVFLDESGIKDNTSATYDCKDKKSRRYRAIQLHHKKSISMMGDLGNNPPIIMRIQ